MANLRVLIAMNVPACREGLVHAFSDRDEVGFVGECSSEIGELLGAIEQLDPHIALVSSSPPDLAGKEIVNATRQAGFQIPIVLISSNGSQDLLHRSISAGAAAHISIELEPDVICKAVAAIARGESLSSTSVNAALVSPAAHADGQSRFTTRELEILLLTAEGYSAGDASRRLHLSESTVKTHLRKLYSKLGVSDRGAAVAEGMRRGLIE